jgi:hypothetical protein
VTRTGRNGAAGYNGVVMSNSGVDIRNLSDEQFRSLGLPSLVYIRRGVLDEGQEVFAIHAANGEIMGIADDTESVASALEEHSMVPMTIH